ncbi:MAG: CinA family protein [Chloroflexota bacterium]|jgi:PncC family amidohydrolase|nr:CinA family protein [Chloroflexota bacterium]
MVQELLSLSSEIGKLLTDESLTIASAESCTGGLIGHILTGVSGSSQYYLGGVIAYSNRIKEEILGVQSQTLLQHGAVSKETACEMAKGIRKIFEADIGVATTGIAGPTGGTPTKPVGLVWIGISTKPNTQAFEYHFKGSRNDVKTSTVKAILTRLLDQLK